LNPTTKNKGKGKARSALITLSKTGRALTTLSKFIRKCIATKSSIKKDKGGRKKKRTKEISNPPRYKNTIFYSGPIFNSEIYITTLD
jgi:hypothetical protein